MINDDKPIIRKNGGSFFVYGTPWMGKSNIGSNTKAPVKAVYVLNRGAENSAVRVKPGEVIREILEATVLTEEKETMIKLLSLYDEFFSAVQLFKLTCNISDDAVTTAYSASNIIAKEM